MDTRPDSDVGHPSASILRAAQSGGIVQAYAGPTIPLFNQVGLGNSREQPKNALLFAHRFRVGAARRGNRAMGNPFELDQRYQPESMG